MPLIKWGGKYKGTDLTDTCSFDCVLQMLFYLYNYTSFGREFIQNRLENLSEAGITKKHFENIMGLISSGDFPGAKYQWTKKVLKLDHDWSKSGLSFWEEEREYGLRPISDWFPVVETRQCSSTNCPKNAKKKKRRNTVYFHPESQEAFIQRMTEGNIDECGVCNENAMHLKYKLDPETDYGLFMYHQIAWHREFNDDGLQYPHQTGKSLKKDMILFGASYEVGLLNVVKVYLNADYFFV